MQVICVDDHPVLLEGLVKEVQSVLPTANVSGFTKAAKAYDFAERSGCDVLFCEIALYANGGMTLAERIREKFPHANIIFATVCSEKEFAKNVLQIRASGYITKPVTRRRVEEELRNLRYPVEGYAISG